MNTRTMSHFLTALLVLSIVAVPALAQRGPGGGMGRGPGGPAGKSDFSETLDLYRVQRMREALALTDEQTTKVLGLFGEMRKTREAFRTEREPIVEKLRVEVETPAPDEGKLRSLIADLEKIKGRQDAAEEKSRKALFSILTPVQQARFIFFQSRFESEVRERMEQVRERRREHRQERLESAEPSAPAPPEKQ